MTEYPYYLERELKLFGQAWPPAPALYNPKRRRRMRTLLALVALLLFPAPADAAVVNLPFSCVIAAQQDGGPGSTGGWVTLPNSHYVFWSTNGTPCGPWLKGEHTYWMHVTSLLPVQLAVQGPTVGPETVRTRPEYRTKWTDVSGAEHTVITPQRGDRSLRQHLRDVRVFQEAFPPVLPPPTSG
jgi:hypothetical protein